MHSKSSQIYEMNNCVIAVVSFVTYQRVSYKWYSVIPVNSNPTLQPLWRSNDSYVFIFMRLIYISVVHEKNIIKGVSGV